METSQPSRAPVASFLERWPVSMDLAQHIGSPAWFRGMGILAGISALAISLLPPLPMRTISERLDLPAQDMLRSQSVQPLALGSDMGQRMGLGAQAAPMNSTPQRPRLELVSVLAPGDSVAQMLSRAGVGAQDASKLQEIIAQQGGVSAGTRFALVLGRIPAAGQPRPLEHVALHARFDLDLTLQRQGADFVVERHPIAVDDTPLRIRGQAGDSVYRAARAAGAPMKAIQQFLAAIDAHLNLEEVRRGDTFDMVVAYKRAASGEVEVGDLLYAAIESGGRPRKQLLRWGGEGQLFDAAAMASASARQELVMPVNGARITSGFGLRLHPILGFARMHAGTDLAAAYGSPVRAVADGVASFVGAHGGHGQYIRLEHGGGVGTGYGHLSRFAVAAGSRVRAGQVIGFVGSTGLSTGPHLHYEVFRGGMSVDPMSVHFTVRAGVPQKELAAFKARLASLLRLQPGAALAALQAPHAKAGVGINQLPTKSLTYLTDRKGSGPAPL
ncbi:M23 family metallopeptidase [Novosphingobium umbonatum]|uniref:M23 family metallopeptidase n=1 Tax=Novosphingobium umbonatum TaxID=1908524 RepID=A0A3S2X3S7_9SPHN|nr:M23 family metallopeptidase [Novosphingobium umbonatum]RVU05007.1 M23 family metallopeptidase [Novosphingobium umbonatum]